MSNNYSESRTIIFPSREDRDVWITQCLIAKAWSPKSLSDIENFEVIGDLCLTIWHNGNVNTWGMSKLLQVNNQLAELRLNYPSIGSHHVEGNEYYFDICVNGVLLSFDDFPIIMSGGSDEGKIDCYKAWLEDIRKVITSDTPVRVEEWSSKASELSSFLSVMNQFRSAQALISYTKTDVQIVSLYEILLETMRSAVDAYKRYEITPDSMNHVTLQQADEMEASTKAALSKATLRKAWTKVNT